MSGSTARCASSLVGSISKRELRAYYFRQLCGLIVHHMTQEAHEVMRGEIEVDESYFGGAHKGERGFGATDKGPVFCLLKRGDRVHAQI